MNIDTDVIEFYKSDYFPGIHTEDWDKCLSLLQSSIHNLKKVVRTFYLDQKNIVYLYTYPHQIPHLQNIITSEVNRILQHRIFSLFSIGFETEKNESYYNWASFEVMCEYWTALSEKLTKFLMIKAVEDLNEIRKSLKYSVPSHIWHSWMDHCSTLLRLGKLTPDALNFQHVSELRLLEIIQECKVGFRESQKKEIVLEFMEKILETTTTMLPKFENYGFDLGCQLRIFCQNKAARQCLCLEVGDWIVIVSKAIHGRRGFRVIIHKVAKIFKRIFSSFVSSYDETMRIGVSRDAGDTEFENELRMLRSLFEQSLGMITKSMMK